MSAASTGTGEELARPGDVSHLFGPGQQMASGERAALEGLLSSLRPSLAIEIGTAEGGTLRRIAKHSAEVHSFDLVEPGEEVRALPGVTLHTGDSHVELPRFLAELAADGRNVDFALVDGDHSAEGVRRDIEDLLASDAVRRTVIVMHDTMNPEVRAGLHAIGFGAYPHVGWVELDWVPGYMFRQPPLRHELWGGLGLVLVNREAPRPASAGSGGQQTYPIFELVQEGRAQVVRRERGTAGGLAGAARGLGGRLRRRLGRGE